MVTTNIFQGSEIIQLGRRFRPLAILRIFGGAIFSFNILPNKSLTTYEKLAPVLSLTGFLG